VTINCSIIEHLYGMILYDNSVLEIMVGQLTFSDQNLRLSEHVLFSFGVGSMGAMGA